MPSSFFFDAASDDELELLRNEENSSGEEDVEEDEAEERIAGEDEDGEEEDEDEDDEEEVEKRKRDADAQSPWDFASYSSSVGEEHARRHTTSIDEKISKAIQHRPVPISIDEDEEEEEEDEDVSGAEADKQEEYISEDDEAAEYKPEDVVPKPFFSTVDGVSFHADTFMELNLSRPLLRACETLGYKKPTPIQAACIPLALTGRDLCASAITGSGKTAAFALPTLERLLFRPKRVFATRVLILTPTRELAVQIHSMIQKLAQFTDIKCGLIVGGLSVREQEVVLRSMPDIVVATPGRMIDHLRNSMSVDLDDLAVLILDEADRLLQTGFATEITELVRLCPKRRQTMLFSATMTEEVKELVKLSLNKPLRLSADPSARRPPGLTEEVVRIRRTREANQEAVLLSLCTRTFKSKVIIFSGTKQAAHRLKILFGLAGLKAAELHGNLTQAQRLDSLELFRKQEVDFLIATDVAARGLDIIGVQTVINYACPREIDSYVHRVGRTARAGREGYAVTFVTDSDRSLLKVIAKKVGSKLKSRVIPEQSIVKWSQIIDEMEDQYSAVISAERDERALRKAEMEFAKAENMLEHRDEIYSRPKRTWFMTEKEKKLVAQAEKDSAGNPSGSELVSANIAEDLKMKEKRKREREKNLPRKKRRKLEAAREMLEDDEEEEEDEEEEGEEKRGRSRGKDKKKQDTEKKGLTLVDIGYRRAKAVKAKQRAIDSGKMDRPTPNKKQVRSKPKSQPRDEEMKDLFKSDMSENKQGRGGGAGGAKHRTQSKNSFKSKARYKRR
ncbi:PREDICTED: DEAD-box ATP-dependent RNA helicase 28 [Camelina sativa]|uniref:DEAD-box ATP-dependent RNA helicase 28 n=1 Tax=Camelina sativa TaxID=90675 RepID=A0ABM0V2A4_CAMSA|nr:PREDICTED: DEAD-box ATP-dependent RNA helicase 28 [Camelina sativa]